MSNTPLHLIARGYILESQSTECIMEFFLLIAALFAAYGLPGILESLAQRYRYARAQKRGFITEHKS